MGAELGPERLEERPVLRVDRAHASEPLVVMRDLALPLGGHVAPRRT